MKIGFNQFLKQGSETTRFFGRDGRSSIGGNSVETRTRVIKISAAQSFSFSIKCIIVLFRIEDNQEIESEIQRHIKLLHKYNETKDLGQMLLGKLAAIEQTTTKNLYERYDLQLDD